MSGPIASLAQRARRRYGVFDVDDADRSGLSRSDLRLMVDRGWCEPVARGVYRVSGAPPTTEQRLAVAIAFHGAGAAVSHESAAWSWGMPGFVVDTPTVTVDRGRSQRSEVARARSSLWLPASHVVDRRRLPTTSPARTIFDLAGVAPLGRVARALDHAISRGLCTLEEVDRAQAALARRGRRGTATLRALIEERSTDGWVAPASELERRARAVFATAGLPTPEFEVDLGDDDWVGRVDCLWRGARLMVELDGRRFHGSHGDRAADRRRDNRLMAQGWRVLRFGWEDLVQRPAEVVELIRRALDGRS